MSHLEEIDYNMIRTSFIGTYDIIKDELKDNLQKSGAILTHILLITHEINTKCVYSNEKIIYDNLIKERDFFMELMKKF